jgi:hypothetical protein
MSIVLKTGLDYFNGLSIFEIKETLKEVAEIGKEQQRLRTSDKNRRRN